MDKDLRNLLISIGAGMGIAYALWIVAQGSAYDYEHLNKDIDGFGGEAYEDD